MQHGELLRPGSLEVGIKVRNWKWRDADRRGNKQIHPVEGPHNGAPNVLQLAPGVNVFGRRDFSAHTQSFQGCWLIQFGSVFDVMLVESVGLGGKDWTISVGPGRVSAVSGKRYDILLRCSQGFKD